MTSIHLAETLHPTRQPNILNSIYPIMKHSLLTILFLLVAASNLQAQVPHPERIYFPAPASTTHAPGSSAAQKEITVAAGCPSKYPAAGNCKDSATTLMADGTPSKDKSPVTKQALTAIDRCAEIMARTAGEARIRRRNDGC